MLKSFNSSEDEVMKALKPDADINEIEDAEHVCLTAEGELKKPTELLIHAGEIMGLSTIREDNVDKWLMRLRMLKTSDTIIAVYEGHAWWPSEWSVRNHVGLRIYTDDLNDSEFDDWLVGVIKRRAIDEPLPKQLH